MLSDSVELCHADAVCPGEEAHFFQEPELPSVTPLMCLGFERSFQDESVPGSPGILSA